MSDGVAPSKGAWTPGPWEARPVYWANHPNDPADKPKSIYCYSIFGPAGSNLYIDKVNTKEDALLISKSPQMAELIRCIVEWEADYRRINNLSGHPEWVGRAERLLSELEVQP